MPMLEYLWLLLSILLYLQHMLSSYADAVRVPHALSDILLNESDMPRHKRPARRSDRVSTWNQPLTSGECCPSITRPTAPLGAISKDGRLLQLFRDANTVQKFYETECAPNVRDRACAFIDDSQWVSACKQKYTYTYAIVKDFNVTEPYRIDYMRIKSGCTCSISGPAKSLDQELREEAITKELLHELTAEYLEEKK